MKSILKRFDEKTEIFTEMDVWSALNDLGISSANEEMKKSQEFLAENMAFAFLENCKEFKGEKIYFQPLAHNADNSLSYPDVNYVNEAVLNYWIKRANETKNHLLMARYAGLAWEFSIHHPAKTKTDIKMAWKRIDSVCELARTYLQIDELDIINKLTHAIRLAQSINDPARVDKVIEAIFFYEENLINTERWDNVGFSFDILRGMKISDLHHQKMIENLENKISRMLKINQRVYPSILFEYTKKMCEYYQQSNESVKLEKLLTECANKIDFLINSQNSSQSIIILNEAYKLFQQFGKRDICDQFLRKISDFSPLIKNELITMPNKLPDIDERVMAAMMEGGLEESLKRFAKIFIPPKKRVVEMMGEFAARAPIVAVSQRFHLELDGRIISKIKPMIEDADAHLPSFIAEYYLGIYTPLLRSVFIALQGDSNFTHAWLEDYIFQSPLFMTERKKFISRGLKAYMEKDLFVAVPLLIIEIEPAIRALIKMNGGVIFKRGNGSNRSEYDQLNIFLDSDIFIEIFGEDVSIYLKTLFTSDGGFKLRHNVAHGSLSEDICSIAMADWIIHVFIVLAQYRKNLSKLFQI